MSRRLAYTVQIITDEQSGAYDTYRRGTMPPPEVAELITNPAAWAPEVPARPANVNPAPPAAEPEPSGDSDAAAASDGGQAPAGNASTETWAAYAQALGADVPEGATRSEIKALLADRGLLEQ